MTRPLPALLLAAAAALLFAGPAAGAPFAEGALIVKIGALQPLRIDANAGAAVTDLGGPIEEQAGAFGPSDVDLPDSLFTGVPSVSDLRVSGLGKPAERATFSTGFASITNDAGPDLAGSFGGVATMQGTGVVCHLGCDSVQIPIPLSRAGAGGTASATVLGSNVFVRNGPWTTGAAVVTIPNTTPGGRSGIRGAAISHTVNSQADAATVLPFKGHTTGSGAKGVTTVIDTATPSTSTFTLGGSTFTNTFTTRTMTLSGFDGRDASGVGTVQLVAPSRGDTGPEVAGSIGVFSVQRLTFVPEPGTLALLGAGVAALAAAGRRSRRR